MPQNMGKAREKRVNPLIVRAIEAKRRLKLRYYGGERIVEPCVYGLDRLGDALLICYQVGGTGNAERDKGWQQFRLYEVVSVSELDEWFVHERGGYEHLLSNIVTIYAQI
jgi:hypothetical protein